MAASWESHKDTLRTLYIDRGETLKDIMSCMSELHGFKMSKGQYERQFKKWGFRKYSKAERWAVVSRKVAWRQTQGKLTMVRKDGEEVSQERLNKERRHASAMDLVQFGDLAPTPEGFSVCTPRYDAAPRIFINNMPSLKLFSLLRLHLDSTSDFFGGANQDLVSRMTNNSERIVTRASASASVQCDNWICSLAGDKYPNLDNASDSTTFEIEVPSELSSITRAGGDSRLLLSIIHSAANNLLSEGQASGMLPVILQNSNRKIFHVLIAGQSPATKAIARTFLPGAIDSLDCSLVKALLDTSINPSSSVGNSRRRPLEIAIASQSMEIMRLLLEHGADFNVHFAVEAFYGHADTPLKVAVQTCRLDLVQLLLRVGARVNDLEPGYAVSALQFAAKSGNLGLVQLLLDAGADVHAPALRFLGKTALQAAAGAGNIEVVQLLLSCGADVNVPKEKHGKTALGSAACSGNVDITQLLIFHGATDIVSALEAAGQSRRDRVVNFLLCSRMRSHFISNDTFGRTALQAATRCGDFELVRTLLECGVCADAPPTDGATSWQTTLQIASHHGDIRIAELLISYGADVNAPAMPREDSGQGTATALQEAVSENHMQLVQILLNHGADVNAPSTHRRRTALEAAVCQGNLEIFELLWDHGADMKDQGASVVIQAIGHVPLGILRILLDTWTDAWGGTPEWTVDEHGQTALEIAAGRLDTGLIRLLLEYEADDESLALQRAVSVGDLEIVEMLIESGACLTDLEGAAKAGDLDILRLSLETQTTPLELGAALQVAVDDGNMDAAQLLLDYGADVNTAPVLYLDGAPRTALQAAAGNSDLEMLRFLLEAGADVESKGTREDERATALQFAAIAGSMSVVTLLIEKGADVNAPAMGKDRRTALEGAAEHGRLDVVQLLLNLGVEVAGSRAMQFAREEGHDGVIALLTGSS